MGGLGGRAKPFPPEIQDGGSGGKGEALPPGSQGGGLGGGAKPVHPDHRGGLGGAQPPPTSRGRDISAFWPTQLRRGATFLFFVS